MKNAISAPEPRLLSLAEVAWLLGINESSVCRAIRIGLLPVVRRRQRVMVPAHVLAYLADAGDSCAETHGRRVVGGDAR